MQKLGQTESSQDIQLKESTPDSMIKEPASEVQQPNKAWTFNIRRCMFLLMLVICSVALGYEINAQAPPHIISHQTITNPADFNFLVFCPIIHFSETTQFKGHFQVNEELRRRRLYETYSNKIVVNGKKDLQNFNASRTFLVQVTSNVYNFTDQNGTEQSTIQLFYCGLVTGFYDDCSNAVVACSTPGPMFDIPSRDPIDIVWVNNLNSSMIPSPDGECIDPTYASKNKAYCTLMAKVNKTQTFLDPTKNDITSKTAYKHIPITNRTWPMVTHLHGAEIRPSFDGNPLSWIDNSGNQNGNYGVAAFSYDNQCYYDSFDRMFNQSNFNPPKITLRNILTGKEVKNYKINRYPNQQNPGSLWYHDHAMHLTSYNVKSGLSGFYILRDTLVQSQIGVDRKCEKLVMMAGLNLINSFPLTGFTTGLVYRFKFLNNNFDDVNGDVLRIYFSYGNCSNPSQRQSFTIIGADSSLFNTGIPDKYTFVIAQAERLELLIKFQEGRSSFSICGDTNLDDFNEVPRHHGPSKPNARAKLFKASNYVIENIQLTELAEGDTTCQNTRTTIDDVILSVPFTDLSLVPDSEIAVKRMRPLIWVNPVFTINGRTDFHKGQSENPMIGTIQDWFIINTIFFSHPIHVHLINFQVIKEYQLTVINAPNSFPSTCTLYELDFLIAALLKTSDPSVDQYKELIFPKNADVTIDYNYTCNNLFAIYKIPAVINSLELVNPEQTIDANRVSGINVLDKRTPQDIRNLAPLANITSNYSSQYKYVANEGAPSPKDYYARWKDTAYVEEHKVLQYRIRWTKSNFTVADAKAGTYFHVPADQLREYPGFIYHCHILPHEDNEMMRPIMLQLPRNTHLNLTTPCNYNIESKQPVLKWADKYNCVNKQCGNTPT